jgi:Thermopsin
MEVAQVFSLSNCSKSQGLCVSNLPLDYSVYENGRSGEYWVQDIPQIAQSGSSYKVTAEDNIWNFSTATAYLKGTIYENLLGDCSPYGKGSGGEFYYCYAKQSFTTTLPFEVEMIVLTGVDDTFSGHKGASAVEFEFGVYHDGTLLGFKAYDWVDFNSNNAPAGPLIHVGGFNPFSYNDFETLVAGPNGGSYAPSTYGTFVVVPHAWSAGSDTAETASGVHMTGSGHTGIASSGADNNAQLF